MGRLPTVLAGKPLPDESAVAAIVQRLQALGKQGRAALCKIGRAQVGRCGLKRVKERTRQRRKNGGPAQQAEQAVDERILGVVNGRLIGVPMCAQGPFHRRGRAGVGQGQLQRGRQGAGAARGLGCGRGSTAWLRCGTLQARQHARQALGFFLAFGRGQRQQGQCQRVGMAAHALVHADAPVPCAGVLAVGIGLLGQWPVGRFFAGLTQAHQQFGAAAFQPGVGAGGLHCGGQQGRAFCAIVQRLAQGVQHKVVIHIGAALKRPRLRIKRHHFVLEQPQVGQYEFRPALVQVAKEHEPQPGAQRRHLLRHTPHGFGACRVPLSIRLGGGVVRLQGLQQRGLGQRFGGGLVRAGGGKQRRHLAMRVYRKQLG